MPISDGNLKIGKIPNWSQTPGTSCPGMTKLCSSLCYAQKANRAYPTANAAWSVNTSASIEEKENLIVSYLERKLPTLFRIHVAGDFDSIGYIDLWKRIALRFPKTKFLAFTRSWRVERLADAIHSLSTLKNVTIYASLDDEANDYSGPMPVAYMGEPETKDNWTKCKNAAHGLKCDECKLCFSGRKNVYFPIH